MEGKFDLILICCPAAFGCQSAQYTGSAIFFKCLTVVTVAYLTDNLTKTLTLICFSIHMPTFLMGPYNTVTLDSKV